VPAVRQKLHLSPCPNFRSRLSPPITDPTVPNGGSVEPGVADIATNAQTTLAYSENTATPPFGFTDGRYAAALALLGNYIAGGFGTTAGANGGAPVSGTPLTEQQTLLTHPPHG
jgi:hypothetical protein